VAGGEVLDIRNMSKKSNSDGENKQKLRQIVALLKFVKTLDDEEIIKSTIESIVELLEEEIDK
jgi:hypothetical protein